MSRSNEKKTVGIVGLGVMGGSFAKRLKELGYPVIGFEKKQEVIDYALANGIIDAGTTHPEDLLGQCEDVIFCIYPNAIAPWIEANGPYFRDDALLIEISGVKSSVIGPIQEAVPERLNLVSIHPMCGRESQGIEYSTSAIFRGANFIVIEPAAVEEAGQPARSLNEKEKALHQEVKDLAREMGFGTIASLSPQDHDRMIGFLSQLTHVIAVCLMNTHENSHLVEYTGDSFRDLTRIAKINETMWPELFLLNKDILLDEISLFEESISHFRKALEEEDVKEMQDLMIQSTRRRERFDLDR